MGEVRRKTYLAEKNRKPKSTIQDKDDDEEEMTEEQRLDAIIDKHLAERSKKVGYEPMSKEELQHLLELAGGDMRMTHASSEDAMKLRTVLALRVRAHAKSCFQLFGIYFIQCKVNTI